MTEFETKLIEALENITINLGHIHNDTYDIARYFEDEAKDNMELVSTNLEKLTTALECKLESLMDTMESVNHD